MKPYDDQGVFGPATLRILDRAKQSAREIAKKSRDVSDSDEQEIAKHILDQAQTGERRIDRLVLGALQALSPRQR